MTHSGVRAAGIGGVKQTMRVSWGGKTADRAHANPAHAPAGSSLEPPAPANMGGAENNPGSFSWAGTFGFLKVSFFLSLSSLHSFSGKKAVWMRGKQK